MFDSGVKKLCRHNQYFGIREAQRYLRRREGGDHLAHPGLG
ncbi:hypothetical protein UMZ34_09210 [Halopseudomonas pachastrellae]|nr:hypothetical protein UMZ34_09210 [Halopseudomonas pachastrellae]